MSKTKTKKPPEKMNVAIKREKWKRLKQESLDRDKQMFEILDEILEEALR